MGEITSFLVAGEAPRGTVLVIDDSAVAQHVVRARLERRGFRVVTLDSPSSAAEAIAEHHPDVVVLDLDIPGLEGGSAESMVRGIEGAPPIVIHSSLAAAEVEARAAACGAVGAIAKTSDDGEFVRRFEEIFTNLR